MNILEDIIKGNAKSLGRFIRSLEQMEEWAYVQLSKLLKKAHDIPVIGITGPQGVGKSTLIDQLITSYRAKGKRVAVLLVDPRSPRSGGTFFGDRIRMQRHANDPFVFIKSISAYEGTGALGVATWWVVEVFKISGFDSVIVETIGVGQNEIEVKYVAHTTVVVLAPSIGDEIQLMKGGLLDIADIVVVNKADRPESDILLSSLPAFQLTEQNEWKVPVIKANALTGFGVNELTRAIEKHLHFLREKGAYPIVRLKSLRKGLEQLALHEFKRLIDKLLDSDELQVPNLLLSKKNIYEVVSELLKAASVQAVRYHLNEQKGEEIL